MGGNNVNVTIGAKIDGLISGVNDVKGELQGLAEYSEGLIGTFTGIGEAIAAAFAVEQIESFIEHFAQLGGQIESSAAQLGRSTEEVLALKYAAAVADTELQSVTRAIDHFYMSVQAAEDPTSKQAAAFRALGIDVKKLRDQNVDLNTIFDMTVDKLGQFKDGGDKTIIIMDLLGNKSAQTAKLVNILSEGMDELVSRSNALQAPTERQVELWGEVSVRIADLKTVMDNWKLTLGDISNLAVRAAEGFVEFLSIVKAIFDGVGVILAGALDNIKDFGVGVKNVFLELADPGEGYFDRIKGAAKAAMQKMADDTHNAGKAVDDLIDKEKKLIDALENPTLQDKGTNKTGPKAPGVDDSSQIRKQMQVWEDALTEMLLKQKLFGQEALQEELKFWQAKLLVVKKGTTDYFAIEKKIYEAEKQLNAQRVRDDQKDMREREARWNKFFQSFNSGLMSMIKGTGSWRDFVRNAFFNVLENGLKMMEKLVAHWLVTEKAKTAATVAGNAARTASDVSANKASSGGFGAKAIAEIQGDAAKAYSGVYGFLAPAMGPFAAIPAAAAYVSVIGMEALVPSFDVGTWGVPHDGLAMLHKNEKVLTESENLFGTGSRSGGNGMSVHFHGGINDRQSIRRLFMEEGPTLKKSIEKQGTLSNKRKK